MNKAVKLAVDQLILDLQHRSEDFACGEHTLFDGKTKYEYWVSNGFFSAGVYRPFRMGFGFYHGFRFHMALSKWKAAKICLENSRQSQP